MTFPDTTAQTFDIEDGAEYLVTATGGNFAIERYTEAGAWEAVPDSPLVDGEHKRLMTASANLKIRVTPTAGNTEFTIHRAR